MPPDDPDDLKAFLPTTEDFARALDREAADARTEASLRKAAQNTNLADAVAALNEPAADGARPAQASERVEYNPAKTVPPRTRRDTLEVVQKIEVATDLLDPRHRPTARISRATGSETEAGVATAAPSTPPAPGVSHDEAVPSRPEASRKRYLIPLLLLLGVVVGAFALFGREAPPVSAAGTSGLPVTAAAPPTPASPPSAPAPSVSATGAVEEPTAEPTPSAEVAPPPTAAKPSLKPPRTNTTAKPAVPGMPKAVD